MYMAFKHATSDQPNSQDVARYRANYLSEQEGVYLYSKLAETERDTHLAELYRRLASIEQRHSDLWKDYLTRAGATSPAYAPPCPIRPPLWLPRPPRTAA